VQMQVTGAPMMGQVVRLILRLSCAGHTGDRHSAFTVFLYYPLAV